MAKCVSYFSFDDCRFNVQKAKEATQRVAMWRELKIPFVYTMEASFFGADIGETKGSHFEAQDLAMAGVALC